MASVLLLTSPNYRWEENKGKSPYGSDFLQDWTAGSMIAAGRASQLYDLNVFKKWQHDSAKIGFRWEASSYYPTVYPPPYYLLVTPLCALEYRWAVLVWLALLLAAMVGAAVVIERFCVDEMRESALRWFWPCVLLFPAMLLGLTICQKGTIWLLAWAVTWYFLKRGRPISAGLVFGLMSVKPTLFFLLPLVMLWKGQWRFVCGAGASASLLWLAAACILPWNVWPAFLDVAFSAGKYHLNSGYHMEWSSNLLSLVGSLELWSLPLLKWMLLGPLLVFALQFAFATARCEASNPVMLLQILLATCLLSPHFYCYDLVVLLLPIRLMWSSHRSAAQVILAVLWVSLLVSPLWQPVFGVPLMPIALIGVLAISKRIGDWQNILTAPPISQNRITSVST